MTYFERGFFSDVFAGHSLNFLFILSFLYASSSLSFPPLTNPKQPQPNRVVEGQYRNGRGLSVRMISDIIANYWNAKSRAFLLQLSEGLTKGKMQLCSNILIIFCVRLTSLSITTWNPHQDWRGVSLPLLSTILFNLIFPSSSHVV